MNYNDAPFVIDTEFTSKIGDLDDLVKKYCVCTEDLTSLLGNNYMMDASLRNTNQAMMNDKRLVIEQMNFSSNISTLFRDLEEIKDEFSIVRQPRSKSQRKVASSARRCRFIGVSKNGTHWQALITIKMKKTYIGTFDSSEEAARAFDIYSLLLHSLKARTNFTYTKLDIMEIINQFTH